MSAEKTAEVVIRTTVRRSRLFPVGLTILRDMVGDAVAGVPVAFPTGSGTTDTSTGATDATRMPTWQPDTHGCWRCPHSVAEHGRPWSGACIWQHRSTSC